MPKMPEAGGIVGTERWEVCRPQVNRDGQGFIHRSGNDPAFVAEVRKYAENYKDKTKVLICEPSIGFIDYRAHESVVDLAVHCARYETRSNYKFFKTTMGRLLVPYAREKFAELAVDAGFEYVLFIDDDHVWPKDIFERLQAHIKDYDMVAPLCLQRSYPYNPVIYKRHTTQSNGTTYIESKFHLDWEKGDLVTDADAIGFGCVIVKTELFKRIPQPWFFNMAPIGEDLSFCFKAKDVGCKILVDTSIEAPHLSEGKAIDWSDYERAKGSR